MADPLHTAVAVVRRVRIARLAATTALALVLLVAPNRTTRAAGIAKPKSRAGTSTAVRPRPTNPHVHTTPKAPAAKPGATKTTTFRGHRRSHVRLAHPTKAGRGTIAGVVRTADYQPVRGAFVRLAKPGGHRFRNSALRHGTYTRADGSFVMCAVRGGRYRVAASKRGVGHGHVPAHLAAGGNHRVQIDLAAAKRTRKHK